MADYVVTLTGKDNLSNTIKTVKQELDGVGGSANKLDKINAKFDKITKSTMPLNRQVKETSKLLSQMNFDGDFNAAQFLKMAKEAGKAKDAISDTQQIIKAFADDNFWINATIQGIQGIAAAGSVATGTMALFGVENENVHQALLKVQGVMAVLNGVQSVANVLNKDSYVSIARKVLGLKAQAAATGTVTTATNTATIAQIKNNLAVLANPYVAAAAALAALTAAVVYYVKKVTEMSDAEKGVQEAMKSTEEATKKGQEAYGKTSMEMEQLKRTVDTFTGSKSMEKKLVEELNSKYGTALGKYKTLNDWKKALTTTSFYYCKVMEAEAKLTALNTEAYNAYAKAIAGEDYEQNMSKFNKLKEEANKALDDVNFYKGQLNIAIDNAGGFVSSSSKVSGATRSSKVGGGSNKTNNKPDYEVGSTAELSNKLKEVNDKLQKQNLELSERVKLLKQAAELEDRIARIKRAEDAYKNGSLADALNPKNLSIAVPEIDSKNLETSLDHLETAYDIAIRKQEEFRSKCENFSDVTNVLGSNFSALSTIFKETGDSATAGMMQLVSITMQGVSQVIPQIMALIGAKEGEALASGTASAASLPFPANIGAIASITATILATFASILSATKGFADGGIIGGTSYSGDKLLARVNSGEMVLNKRQQSNLFNAINSGNIGGGTVSTVEFKLRGSDIYGSMKNYKAIKSKSGLTRL